MCMCALPGSVSIPHVCLVPVTSEEGIGSCRTEVTDSGELPCGCWELNPDSLKELSYELLFLGRSCNGH